MRLLHATRCFHHFIYLFFLHVLGVVLQLKYFFKQYCTVSDLISSIPLYLSCVSETASAEINERGEIRRTGDNQEERNERCGTLGELQHMSCYFTVLLWLPLYTLLAMMLQLSCIRSAESSLSG